MRHVRSRATRTFSRLGLMLGALLLLTGPASAPVVAAQSSGQPAGIEMLTLATRALDEAPLDRRWVLRRGHPLNEDAHAHAGGFIYAARGSAYLIVEDEQGMLMEEGRARWAPEGIGHLHATPSRASSAARNRNDGSQEIWTILLERELDARQPAAVTSPPLRRLASGAYEARLVLLTFQPGASTGLRCRTGPELAYTLDGAWELVYDGVPWMLGAAQGYLADPGVPHTLRNVGAGPARVLSAQLVPLGQPAEEPAP